MPVSWYFEADISLLGFNILSIGFLAVKDPNTILEPQHSTQLPGVIRCNLIWLGCEEFGKVYGFEAFENFCYPNKIHPLVFAQMCTLYHQGKTQAQSSSSPSNNFQSSSIAQSQSASFSNSSTKVTTLGISSEAKKKDPSLGSDSVLGQVCIGSYHEAICILANSVKVLKGKTSKIAC